MAGKGSKLRKGANLTSFWKNYPFEEKNTVTYWTNKLGESVIPGGELSKLEVGTKITETQFLELVEKDKADAVALEMTDKDIEEMKECMNSMSFSEFEKIKIKK